MCGGSSWIEYAVDDQHRPCPCCLAISTWIKARQYDYQDSFQYRRSIIEKTFIWPCKIQHPLRLLCFTWNFSSTRYRSLGSRGKEFNQATSLKRDLLRSARSWLVVPEASHWACPLSRVPDSRIITNGRSGMFLDKDLAWHSDLPSKDSEPLVMHRTKHCVMQANSNALELPPDPGTRKITCSRVSIAYIKPHCRGIWKYLCRAGKWTTPFRLHERFNLDNEICC